MEGGTEVDNNTEGGDDRAAESNSRTSMAALPAIFKILSSGGLPTAMFFNLFFWLNVGMSLVENLLFLFFQFDLHASNFVCGLSVVVTVVFEIPLFAKAPELLDRLGAPALAVIGSLAFVVRGFGYTVSPNGWVVLLLEPLHGVTVAANETATVAYIAERTPAELEATGQAVLTLLRTLAYTIGTGLGGWVMQNFGSKTLYRAAGLAVLSATAAFVVVDRMARARDEEAVAGTEDLGGELERMGEGDVGLVQDDRESVR